MYEALALLSIEAFILAYILFNCYAYGISFCERPNLLTQSIEFFHFQ